MIIEYKNESILNHTKGYIAHGVNCRNKMGSGVAKVLFTEYPEIKEGYHEYCNYAEDMSINGSKDMLGAVQCIKVNDDLIVLNCFTQYNYGYDGKLYVSYDAIKKCFSTINMYNKDDTIAIPKIGCGLAGGDWEIVSKIINETTPDVDIVVYDFKG